MTMDTNDTIQYITSKDLVGMRQRRYEKFQPVLRERSAKRPTVNENQRCNLLMHVHVKKSR